MASDQQQQQQPTTTAPRPQTWVPTAAEPATAAAAAAAAAGGPNGSAAPPSGGTAAATAPQPRSRAEYEFPPRVAALTDRPIFIVGCPRSGTTWVQRLLVSDARVAGGQESHFFTVFGGAMESARPAKPGGRVVGLRCYWDESSMASELRRLWRMTMRPVVEAFPNATVLIEKTPDHATEIARILKVLPESKFIHVIRDARGVANSMQAARKHFWGKWAAGSPKDAALWWTKAVTSARAAGAPLGPDRYTEVFYEDLLADTAGGLRKLFAFCGVDVTPEQTAAYAESNTFEKQASKGETGLFSAQGGERAKSEPTGFFNTGTADGWKKSLPLVHRALVWRYARRTLRDFGYDWNGRKRGTV